METPWRWILSRSRWPPRAEIIARYGDKGLDCIISQGSRRVLEYCMSLQYIISAMDDGDGCSEEHPASSSGFCAAFPILHWQDNVRSRTGISRRCVQGLSRKGHLGN
jgi:hypothetical protein